MKYDIVPQGFTGNAGAKGMCSRAIGTVQAAYAYDGVVGMDALSDCNGRLTHGGYVEE